MLKLELKGKTFGRLKVLSEAGRNKLGYVTWKCWCNHNGKGKPSIIIVRGSDLPAGRVQSCGCLLSDTSRAHGKTFLRHGLSNTPLYLVWRNMKARCLNPRNKNYSDYGGRGIGICDEWMVSDNFFEWAKSTGYQSNLTIERRDNDLGYCPDNCYWTTRKVQQRHRRKTIMFEIKGVKKSMAEWAEVNGVPYTVARERYNRGWSPADAVTIPASRHTKRHKTVNGELIRSEGAA